MPTAKNVNIVRINPCVMRESRGDDVIENEKMNIENAVVSAIAMLKNANITNKSLVVLYCLYVRKLTVLRKTPKIIALM